MYVRTYIGRSHNTQAAEASVHANVLTPTQPFTAQSKLHFTALVHVCVCTAFEHTESGELKTPHTPENDFNATSPTNEPNGQPQSLYE